MPRGSLASSLAASAMARLAQDPSAMAGLLDKLTPAEVREAEARQQEIYRKQSEARKSPHAHRNNPTQRDNRERAADRARKSSGGIPSGCDGLDEYYQTPLYVERDERASNEQMQRLRALITMAERKGVVKAAESGRWSWVFRQASGMSKDFCEQTTNHFKSLLGNDPNPQSQNS